MKANYTRVMRTLSSQPWAVLPGTLETICGIVEARVNGAPSFTTDEIRAHLGAKAAAGVALQANGSIAVISLAGVLGPKMNAFTNMSGGTSLDQFRSQLRKALADTTVKAIVIAIDSPGGSIVGCEETWTEIMAARGTKPIVGSVDALMASAALWLGSACDSIEMTPSGEAGSLGVYVVHADQSEAEAQAGIKVTYVASDISPFKVDGNESAPLSDTARAYLQDRVNAVANTFLTNVAKGRKLATSDVAKTFGQGRTLSATDALAVKMIDRIATFDQTVARLAGTMGGKALPMRGAADVTATIALDTNIHTLMAGVVPKSISEDLAPKDEAWSAPTLADFTDQSWGDLSDMDKNQIAEHYAWAKQLPPAAFSDLKLPHHQPKGGAVVYRAVVAALGRLDAMSDIPAADKPHVKAHLEHHEQQFAAAAEPAKASALQAEDVIIEIDDDDDGCEQCAPDCPCEMDECAPGCETCAPACACGQPAGQADVTDESDSAAAAVVAASCGD